LKTISSPFNVNDVQEVLKLYLAHDMMEISFGINLINNKNINGENSSGLNQLLE